MAPANARELHQEMRAALRHLATCSHVPAAGWGPRGRSGATEGGNRPPGDLGNAIFALAYGPPFVDQVDEHAARAVLRLHPRDEIPRDAERQRRVLHATRAEFEHLRGYAVRDRPAGESLAQLSGRIVDEFEGIEAREAAYRCRCGITTVWKAREHAGRERELGKEPPAERLAAGDRARRARELAADGMTIAQIRRLLGASRSTIERDLGKRAA